MALPHTNERFSRSLEKLLGWRIFRGDPIPGAFIFVAMRRGLHLVYIAVV